MAKYFYTEKGFILEGEEDYKALPAGEGQTFEIGKLYEEGVDIMQDCKDDSYPPFSNFCTHCSRSRTCGAPFIKYVEPERMFSLKEALEIWDAGGKQTLDLLFSSLETKKSELPPYSHFVVNALVEVYKVKPFPVQEPCVYFKQTFNIDIPKQK